MNSREEYPPAYIGMSKEELFLFEGRNTTLDYLINGKLYSSHEIFIQLLDKSLEV